MTETFDTGGTDRFTGLPTLDWRRCAAFLDFDGTLAPLEPRPQDVRLPGRERRLVARLLGLCGGGVAILTGRDLADVRPHFDGLAVSFGGSHGAEILVPGGTATRDDRAEAFERPLRSLDAFARDHDLLLERKTGALALHYRGRPEAGSAVQALVEKVAAAAPDTLKPLHGNMVSEVTLRGHDKGTALRQLMSQPPFHGRLPVAIGDDTTDEDAIRAAQALGGIGLRIGAVTSEARHAFPDRDAFVGWLEETSRND